MDAWATDNYRVEDSEMWCRRAAGHFLLREQFAYRISLKGSDAHLGNLSAHRVDWKIRMAEIGYWLRTDEQGHGYMTEAVIAVTNLLRSIGLRRIEVRCDVENKKSAAVPPRCGYQLEGTFRSDALDPAGKPRSTFIFAKVFDDAG